MTIRLPGIMEEIQPALGNIGNVLNNIVNPNYQQQAALRDMVLKNPALAQELIDLGPEAVERAYGKGTGGIAVGEKSSEYQMKKLKSGEFNRIMKGGTQDEKDELIASLSGIKTPTERKIQGLQVQSGEQNVAGGAIELADKQRVAALQPISKAALGKVKSAPFRNKHLLSPEEIQAIQTTDSNIWNNDMNAYFREQDDARMAQAAIDQRSGRLNMQDYMQRASISKSEQILAKTGRVIRPEMISHILTHPEEMEKYRGKAEPEDATQKEVWRAANDIASLGRAGDTTEMNKAMIRFKMAMGDKFKTISNPKANEKDKMSAIEDLNNASLFMLSDSFSGTPPQWAYDKEGKGNREASFMGIAIPEWAQNKQVRMVVPHSNGGQVVKRSATEIKGAAQAIISGAKDGNGQPITFDVLATTMTREDAADLQKEVGKLQSGGKTTTPAPTPVEKPNAAGMFSGTRERNAKAAAERERVANSPAVLAKRKAEKTQNAKARYETALGTYGPKSELTKAFKKVYDDYVSEK